MSRQTDPEVWKIIPSLPKYLASTHGRIMRIPHLAPMPHGGLRHYGGEPVYGAWCEETRRYLVVVGNHSYKVARLICEAFHGLAPEGKPVCAHLDEDSRNNRPENLRWMSQRENLAADGYRAVIKERSLKDLRKLTADDAVEMRRRAQAGETVASIAKAFSVSAGHASRVIAGHIFSEAA